jgi:hypothetical protein
VATQTKTPAVDSVEAVAERLTELNEHAVVNGRKAGAAYVTSYEKAVMALVDSYEKAAAATLRLGQHGGDGPGRFHPRGHQGVHQRRSRARRLARRGAQPAYSPGAGSLGAAVARASGGRGVPRGRFELTSTHARGRRTPANPCPHLTLAVELQTDFKSGNCVENMLITATMRKEQG